MEELAELRTAIEEHRYSDALNILGELEEMSREDKINKIQSFAVILLLHLIKQQAEQRSTRSWEFSIFNSIFEIQKVNKRRKAGGYYLNPNELREIVTEVYPVALKKAALETFEGQYTTAQLAAKVDRDIIESKAIEFIFTDTANLL